MKTTNTQINSLQRILNFTLFYNSNDSSFVSQKGDSSFWMFVSRIVCVLLCCLLPLGVQAQSYEQLWKTVDNYQQKDLPRSAIQQLSRIYEKALHEKNVGQQMKAYLERASEQVKLTPDSAEVEMERLHAWAESESNPVVAALLHHVLGNIEMQKNTPDWKKVLSLYRSALKEKDVLLGTSAADYVPMTVSTVLSRSYFQDNLYDLLVHQTIAGFMSNWQWRRKIEVQEWIIDLYDSLIDCYGKDRLNLPAAAMLSHEAKILFLSEVGVASQFQLSKEQTEKALRNLLRLYEQKQSITDKVYKKQSAMADAFVDVYLKLAETLCNQQKLVEAMEVLQKAQKKYPKSMMEDDLRAKMEWLQEPSLAMRIPLVYPEFNGQLEVNYKNVTEVKVETYQLRLTPASPELNGKLSNEVLCRTYGKKVATHNYRLPATTDYQARIEKLAYQLPEAGIYVMKVSPVDRKGKSDYRIMYVSPYQMLVVPLLDGRTEIVVVDRISGNPAPHAEVVQYQSGKGSSLVSPKVWKTDEKGSVILKNPKRGSLFVNARTSANDFMEIQAIYPGRKHTTSQKGEWRQLTTLFTDRALYRPGQVVHVSGVRYEQLEDSLRTLQGKVMKVELMDVYGKRVGEASAISDLFGVFAVDFTLPKQVFPGHFTLRTDNKAVSIRVENYKRPTFDVAFTPVGKTYTFGDVLNIEGKARTFAGAPVRLAKGTYTVVRSEAWLWRSGGAESVLTEGSFKTDAKGNFVVDVNLEPPYNKLDLDVVPYYNYTIRTRVTDGAGETQEGVLTLPVGKRSLGIQILGLQPKLACERKEKIQFQTMNLNKQLVKTEVTYQVYSISETNSDKEMSEQNIGKGMIQDRASQDNDDRTLRKLVFEGKAMSQESFIPLEIYALPAGKYRLKASTRDNLGREVTISQSFILFSLSDKRPPIQTIQWFYQDGTGWENGNKVSLYVGSSKKNVYVLMDVFTSQKRIRSERILLNNGVRKFDFPYDKSYGDGIVVSFAFLRDGQLYTKQVNLEKPKPQKQLTLKWESFRDQLTPGQQEVWRMKIMDGSGNPVNANLLAALYDASLDKLQNHQWWFQPNFNRWLPYIGIRSLSHNRPVRWFVHFPYHPNSNGYSLLSRDAYSSLLSFAIWNRSYYAQPATRMYASPEYAIKSAGMPRNGVIVGSDGAPMAEDGFTVDVEESAVEAKFQEELILIQDTVSSQPLRQNFAETAFFYPMLRTDADGEVSISFTLPDALTEWKFMGMAHTQQLDYGMLTSKVKSSKPFMVQPNLPRFVRVGDASTLSASLVNMSMETVKGKVRLELVDPMTDKVVFKQQQDFSVKEGETGVAQFSYKVLDRYDVLVCRVIADAGEFSDGEQHYLPVLTHKEWVTETIPFQVEGNESVDLSLKGLFNQQSRTVTSQKLTIEMTANPNWYVIQALPVVGNPTHEDAMSWATAYYANALAVQIVRNHPNIQKVFKAWLAQENVMAVEKSTNGVTKNVRQSTAESNRVDAFWSKLEANADLKNMLLEETPWLAEAQTESEQKRRVALLFELNGMEQRLQMAARQLKQLQTIEGGWSWYPGMSVSRYTTTQVVELIARLKSMHVSLDVSMNEVYLHGLNYLKQEVKKEYERMLKAELSDKTSKQKTGKENELGISKGHLPLLPSEQAIHYLYICAIDAQANELADEKVNALLINLLLKGKGKESIYGKAYSISQKALMATIMQGNGHTDVATILLQSIKEYLISTPEMGSYFDTYKANYSWNSYRIPTQVAAMEAIQRISPDTQLLNGMKQWLLKQKQVQVWNTPLATVDAIYAFLLTNLPDKNVADQITLQTLGRMKARLGGKEVITPNDALGYTRTSFTRDELLEQQGQKSLYIEKQGTGIGWGTVYAQYFEQMERLNKSHDEGISIEREYWLGNQLVTSKTILHTGDQLTVRLYVKVDRDMDFVAIKDHRSACMEPADQLSGYAWMNGLSAYRVNRDASTEYFIDRLPKGKHVFAYNVYINRTGTYQSGSAVIQSVYAPEFTSHTGGVNIVVE